MNPCFRRIEGSHACAKVTAELLRQVVSHQRVPYTNQASALVDAVKAVGEKLISANPVGNFHHFSFLLIFNVLLFCIWELAELAQFFKYRRSHGLSITTGVVSEVIKCLAVGGRFLFYPCFIFLLC